MPNSVSARIVLVTCGSLREARKIAAAVVGDRLAACVNILPTPVRSVYLWKGKVERATEFLLIIKTTSPRLKPLQKKIKSLHSYDVPEFLVLKVDSGSADYLGWIFESVSDANRGKT